MMAYFNGPRLHAGVSDSKITEVNVIQLLLCKRHNVKFETGGFAGEAKAEPARKDKPKLELKSQATTWLFVRQYCH
ncbi:hypothetical protein D3C81_1689220 [compost metagenome]|uniref:hypothetical protein n=1 Tax=Pseudomonas sp. NUPR-001 TaxID=3416058 RepID=UPI000FC365E3